jgi:hypothetical protein
MRFSVPGTSRTDVFRQRFQKIDSRETRQELLCFFLPALFFSPTLPFSPALSFSPSPFFYSHLSPRATLFFSPAPFFYSHLSPRATLFFPPTLLFRLPLPRQVPPLSPPPGQRHSTIPGLWPSRRARPTLFFPPALFFPAHFAFSARFVFLWPALFPRSPRHFTRWHPSFFRCLTRAWPTFTVATAKPTTRAVPWESARNRVAQATTTVLARHTTQRTTAVNRPGRLEISSPRALRTALRREI